MKNRQKVPFLFAALFIFTILSGCEFFQDIFSGDTVKVSFSLAGAKSKKLGSAKDVSEPRTPNEVVIYNALGRGEILSHTPINPDGTVIELPKDSINIIGFVYNPSLDPDSSGGKIIKVGTFKILLGSYSLDSLPISELAEDELNLGELDAVDAAFLSEIDESSLSRATGFDSMELRSIALLDQIGSTKLNCDIDGNGVYDQEENKRWDFKVIYDFTIPRTELSKIFENEIDAWEYSPLVVYYPQLWSGFSGSTEQDKVFLEFPDDAGVQDGSGASINKIRCSYLADFSYLDVEYYFNIPEDYHPKAPYDGDYRLSMPDNELEFADLHFVNQSNAYEGFFFPVCQLESDFDGKLRTMHYGWKMLHDGKIADADPSLVVNFTNQIIFGLHLKSGSNPCEEAIFIRNRGENSWKLEFKGASNSVISTSTIEGADIGTPGSFDLSATGLYMEDVEYMRNDIHDISENIFAFWSR